MCIYCDGGIQRLVYIFSPSFIYCKHTPLPHPSNALVGWSMKRITLCRIYENSPEAVEAVSFSPCARFIAVARHLGSIQLLDASSFYVYATLPNIFIHGSANSIIWLSKTPSDSAYVDQVQRKLSQYHLVATGLHGLITYWDLESLMPLVS